jgi:hypothetical protein
MFDASPAVLVVDSVACAAGIDQAGWAGVTRAEEVVGSLAARERLDALILGTAATWDAEKVWAADGAVSPVAWLSQHAPLTKQDASVPLDGGD